MVWQSQGFFQRYLKSQPSLLHHPCSTLPPLFSEHSQTLDSHSSVHSFTHVVNSQRSHRSSGQGFHLDACLTLARYRCVYVDITKVWLVKIWRGAGWEKVRGQGGAWHMRCEVRIIRGGKVWNCCVKWHLVFSTGIAISSRSPALA